MSIKTFFKDLYCRIFCKKTKTCCQVVEEVVVVDCPPVVLVEEVIVEAYQKTDVSKIEDRLVEKLTAKDIKSGVKKTEDKVEKPKVKKELVKKPKVVSEIAEVTEEIKKKPRRKKPAKKKEEGEE